ncbi:ribosome assembly cofactor RimP [Candidatus Tachikawaea gelatinosa]|uniref:Ribosome maturation factor RimP n=1 Tax=Candidatus Tachikawaea gelatinosa TaxID=1410383 RepID=A0A090AK93_9ENTR|nr:ribosome assembly cofactor RimP [Candidatus Tachikawaea gelatinosa]BAP58858.1 ribosome maturation factor RimP [Candidatus Tachikawaea gelatinosa]
MPLTEELKKLIQTSIKKLRYECIDIKFIKKKTINILRIYINKETGVTVDDCVNVSQKISELLDINDIFNVSYNLEISSPGLKKTTLSNKQYKNFRKKP